MNREKYLARHRRYNRSEKGRARYARSNAKRIFLGRFYAGREHHYPYPREVIERHLGAMYAAFMEKQLAEARAWREGRTPA